jgi:soluble lytic murein transglycosylase
LANQALKCAKEGLKDNTKYLSHAKYWTEKVNNNREWWILGGQSKSLVSEYLLTKILLFENQIKSNRALAWKELNEILELKNYLSDDKLAELFKKAGELAFLQQNLLLAYEYFSRSLMIKSDTNISSKLESLIALLKEKKINFNKNNSIKKSVRIELEASESENQLFDQMNIALAAGDLVSAIQDGMNLLERFPSGKNAEETEKKLLQIYINIVDKKDSKYEVLEKKVAGDFKKLDPNIALKWGKYLFSKGFYEQSVLIFEVATQNLKGMQGLAEAYLYLGQSQIYISKNKEAILSLQKSTEVGAGSEFSEKAIFYLGLTYFQEGLYSESAAQFEKLIAARPLSTFQLSSQYWLWRSLQKLDPSRAVEVGKALFARYPLSYYGLRARFEIEGSSLDWLKKEGPTKFSLQLTENEYRSWEIANLLVKAGWFEEAQEELKILPSAIITHLKLAMAHLWSWSANYFQSITLFNQVWEEDLSLLDLNSLKIAFPKEYSKYVDRYSIAHKLEANLVLGLIRQESSFRREAKSRAGAMGLMQLMSPTAKEVALRFQKTPLSIPEDLSKPELNIKLGTAYLSQLLRAYEGHLPMALAAYNVGIGNLRKWMKPREHFTQQKQNHSSNYMTEIWIDELPWSETSHYVKAILRNLIIYRMLNQEKLELKDPIW